MRCAVPPPPCGEVEIAERDFGWGLSMRGAPPDVLASLRASTSPQGGGESYTVPPLTSITLPVVKLEDGLTR